MNRHVSCKAWPEKSNYLRRMILMLKMKLECNARGNAKLKMNFGGEENLMLKRYRMMASKNMSQDKEEFPCVLPLRFFTPLVKNIQKERFEFHKDSIDSFLEFSDEYDDKYFHALKATASYMRKWREEGCPALYRVDIDKVSKEVSVSKILERNISITQYE